MRDKNIKWDNSLIFLNSHAFSLSHYHKRNLGFLRSKTGGFLGLNLSELDCSSKRHSERSSGGARYSGRTRKEPENKFRYLPLSWQNSPFYSSVLLRTCLHHCGSPRCISGIGKATCLFCAACPRAQWLKRSAAGSTSVRCTSVWPTWQVLKSQPREKQAVLVEQVAALQTQKWQLHIDISNSH